MIVSAQIFAWIQKLDAVYTDNRDLLTDLDASIGDADHGINIARGFSAVVGELERDLPSDIGAIFKIVSMTLLRKVGGAAGPLYGTFFLKAAMSCSGRDTLDEAGFVNFVEEGVAGIKHRGKASVGDKTMVDAWEPALAAMKERLAAGDPIASILEAASIAADRGRDDTIPLVARKGRASYLGERSKGHQDPGATSTALLLAAARDTLA